MRVVVWSVIRVLTRISFSFAPRSGARNLARCGAQRATHLVKVKQLLAPRAGCEALVEVFQG
jgi:hypothetical protein